MKRVKPYKIWLWVCPSCEHVHQLVGVGEGIPSTEPSVNLDCESCGLLSEVELPE